MIIWLTNPIFSLPVQHWNERLLLEWRGLVTCRAGFGRKGQSQQTPVAMEVAQLELWRALLMKKAQCPSRQLQQQHMRCAFCSLAASKPLLGKEAGEAVTPPSHSSFKDASPYCSKRPYHGLQIAHNHIRQASAFSSCSLYSVISLLTHPNLPISAALSWPYSQVVNRTLPVPTECLWHSFNVCKSFWVHEQQGIV